MLERTPVGLDELIATFGHFNEPTFEANNIVMITLPYMLLFGEQPVTHARCHKLIADNFLQAFTEVKESGFEDQVRSYGGLYAVRAIRGYQAHPSTHSWGIAIDLEPQRYPLGSKNRFPDEIVAIWERAGFFYGGNFKSRKDPMHFQFVRGY